ncbi:MAG TPA: o-succinylbenzoate synthase, partial [Candidatus Acidoferrales bacterium]
MKIERLTLRELRMKLVAPFETSFGVSDERRILLAEVAADGVTGWGEVVAGTNPYYSPETVDTAWHIIRDFVWPVLKGAQFAAAADIEPLLRRVRGHNMAKGGVEAALWDAEARQKGVSLAALLNQPGQPRAEIATGVSIGIKESPAKLVEAVEREVAAGYQRIKVKIKPGKDVMMLAAIRERFPKIRLMADANSAYTLDDAAHLRELDRFYLMMIEQPLGWDDIFSHAKLQKQIQTDICLDECIFTEEQARAAVEIGACRIINIKLGRVGGFSVARRIQTFCQQNNVPVWCGGMLESGIGRAHNIALSTLPNFV